MNSQDVDNSDLYKGLLEKLELVKDIEPLHDSVIQLEMEILFYSGNVDTAVSKCDEFIAREETKLATSVNNTANEYADNNKNAIPYILKANFLSQKGFTMMQQGMKPADVFQVSSM